VDPAARGGLAGMWTRVENVLHGPHARVGCIPAVTTEQTPIASLPVDREAPALLPAQINPGLTPGMTNSPQSP